MKTLNLRHVFGQKLHEGQEFFTIQNNLVYFLLSQYLYLETYLLNSWYDCEVQLSIKLMGGNFEANYGRELNREEGHRYLSVITL